MAYLIDDLNNHPTPKAGTNYFFDTNALLYVMGVSNKNDYEISYINFFNSVFQISTTDKTSRIITCSLQISELFNRLLRLESAKAFSKSPGYKKTENSYFKEVFRKSNEIKKLYEQFREEFLIFKGGFDFLKCPIENIDDVLDFSPAKTDINDHIYVQFVKYYEACMVTHDSDLLEDGMRTLTMNKTLIQASRNFTVSAIAKS